MSTDINIFGRKPCIRKLLNNEQSTLIIDSEQYLISSVYTLSKPQDFLLFILAIAIITCGTVKRKSVIPTAVVSSLFTSKYLSSSEFTTLLQIFEKCEFHFSEIAAPPRAPLFEWVGSQYSYLIFDIAPKRHKIFIR